MTKRLLTGSRYLIAAMIIVVLIPGIGMADEKGKGVKDGGKNQRIARIFAEIGIIPEQEAMMREIQAKAGPARQVHMKQLEVLRAKIKQELQKEKPSKGALNKYASEMGNLHKQMNLASIENILKIKAILTPEQYASLYERGLIGGPEGIKTRGGRPGECKSAFKPGEGPKHRYGPGGKQGGPGKRSGQKNRSGGFAESDSAAPPVQGGFEPIAPPIGTIPEDETANTESAE